MPHLVLIAILAIPIPVSAGPVSVSGAQRQKLVELVKSDPDAGRQFDEIRKHADEALKSEPDPIHFIRSEGKLKNDPEKVATGKSMHDMHNLFALGWAFAVTGDSRYADKARQLLLAWARVNESRGDPIDDTGLEPAIVAYDLVHHTCSSEEKKHIDGWLRKVAEEEEHTAAKKKTTTMNNWHSHRLKVISLIGFVLNDKALIEYATTGFKHQIDQNLKPDGSSFDFHERDALHYHCYDLEPLLTLAIAADQAGIDLYDHTSPAGANLNKSVKFLVPYCDGSKTHAEWVHSKVAFDKKRAESGDEHYKAGTLFEPKSGLGTLERAAYFDPSLDPLILRLHGTSRKYPSWEMVLNAVRVRSAH